MNDRDSRKDRRVNRTRRQLRDALMELILERGYNAVTIEDITERADLGRTTFYLHFRDKEELLVESLEAIAEELKAQVAQLTEREGAEGEAWFNPVAIAFHHVEENRDLYRIILQGEGSNKAASRVREIIEEAAPELFERHMGGRAGGAPDVPGELAAGYFAAALMGFIMLWLEKELPYSGEEAAELFLKLFFEGAAGALKGGGRE